MAKPIFTPARAPPSLAGPLDLDPVPSSSSAAERDVLHYQGERRPLHRPPRSAPAHLLQPLARDECVGEQRFRCVSGGGLSTDPSRDRHHLERRDECSTCVLFLRGCGLTSSCQPRANCARRARSLDTNKEDEKTSLLYPSAFFARKCELAARALFARLRYGRHSSSLF